MVMTERAKRPTLRRLADERDTSVRAMLDVAVREHGTVRKAARALGVSPASIYGWMARNHYRVERRVSRTEAQR